MSLKFIFGGPGSGKTTLCLRDMAKLSEKNNCIFIVPEQFTLESERRLCEFNQKGAVINPQVLSFKRLAYRLSEKSGGGSPLDDSGKVMLLRKITSELLGELEFFVRSANKQGFAEELSKAINEFYQYNISSDTLKALEETLEGGLKIKIGDLRKILARFEEFMRSGYVSSETALESAPKEIAKSRFAVGSYIWLDGFYGFTPQEYDIIEKLMANAERVNVALTLDNDNFGAINDSDPFADIKRAVNRLSKIAKNTGVPIEPPVMLTDHHRFKNSPELAFIEKNFLNHKKQRYKARTENIVIRAAANRRAETESAAVEIITLARKKGLRYKEIAVASGDISGYERSIRRIFDEYGVPFFMDYKTDILSHPLAELLRSAIDCAAFNYNYESVFRFLKTGLTPLSADETDELENYALEFGVSGQKWFSDWKAGLEGDEAVRVNRLREKAKNAFHLFAEQSVRGVKTAKNLSAAVFDMLDLMDVASVIEQWAEKAAERGAAVLAKSHLTAYGKIRAVFDKLVDILGDLRVDIRDFSKIVEAGLMAEDMGFTPPSQDQVIVGDLKRTRLPEIKALIILGANEGVLPAIQKETGVFSDTDRLTLKAAGVEIAPDSRAKNARELLDVYLSLTKPSERLTVSYSLGDFNGKTTRPSQVVFKIADMFPLSETAETDIIAASEPAFGRMGEFLRKTLRGEEPGALKLAWLWFKNNEHYARRLSKLESACEPIRNEAYLSKALTDALYGDEIIIGISRLEQFVKCPFAYYATYGLKARPRRIYEARPADYGLLAHKILENFARIMAEEQSDWRGADKAKIDEFVERYTDDMALGEIFTSSSKRLYMLSRVKRVAKKSIWALAKHIADSDFSPVMWEAAFGTGQPLGCIDSPIDSKRTLKLTGVIDRVDVLELNGKKYIKIIDYKTGAVKFDPDALGFGAQLQLTAYLDAIIKNSKDEAEPAGILYFHLDDPIISFAEDSDEKLERDTIKRFKMSGVTLDDENVIKAMDKNIDKWSDIIPVYLSKNGVGARSSVISQEDFKKLRQFVTRKITDAGKDMARGNISARPYKKEKNAETACLFCEYKPICKIDSVTSKSKFNIMTRANLRTIIDSVD